LAIHAELIEIPAPVIQYSSGLIVSSRFLGDNYKLILSNQIMLKN
jgi:hypothetical protein